jgi:hypothetical protein
VLGRNGWAIAPTLALTHVASLEVAADEVKAEAGAGVKVEDGPAPKRRKE